MGSEGLTKVSALAHADSGLSAVDDRLKGADTFYPMTVQRQNPHVRMASTQERRALVERARRDLPEIVYRSLRLENEPVTRSEVGHAMAKLPSKVAK
jgi:hypothetical protein